MIGAKARQYLTYAALVLGLSFAVPAVYHFLRQDRVQAYEGERLFLAGSYEEAAKHYARAWALGDERPALLHRLGDAYLAAGLFEEALPVFERLEKLEPDGLEIKLKLAELYIIFKRTDAALAFIDQVLEQRPDARGARAMRGKVLTMAGRFEDAIREYSYILDENEQELQR